MFTASMRGRAKRLIQRVGAEEQATRVRELWTPAMRRDRKDNENLDLLLSLSLAVDATCIDVGANVGAVLERLVELAPQGRHFAFEPIPGHAENLRRRFPGVEVHEAAASTENGTAEFHHVVEWQGGYSGFKERDHPPGTAVELLTVPTVRLDDVIPDDVNPAFIKIDVEGAQELVLRGGIETIRRARPIIWFEHGATQAALYGTRTRALWDLLVEDAGLRLFDADGNGPFDLDGFLAMDGQRMWSYVAHP